MSRQSDTEFLYMCAINDYAHKHQLTNREAASMFHTHYVWEHMLSQHEYLHQVALEETFEYVEELMQHEGEQISLYHGTTDLFDHISLHKSQKYRDFGKGFYTTVLENQARDWAVRQSKRRHTDKRYVYEYAFWEMSDLSICRFDRVCYEWLEFVKENRTNGSLAHKYDIVIGPVADDKTMATLQLYVEGTYTAEEAIRRLQYSELNHQFSFHTEKALSCLKLVRRVEI